MKIESVGSSGIFKQLIGRPREKSKRNVKYCVRTDTIFWLQEGNTVRARYFRIRPETALNAAADPRAVSSVRHGTAWPFDPRYQLHQIYRTHQMAISKFSILPGIGESTRASKKSDNNDCRLLHEILERVARKRLDFRVIAVFDEFRLYLLNFPFLFGICWSIWIIRENQTTLIITLTLKWII